MAANDLVATLRSEIERKYREALQALDTLSGYLADSPLATPVTPPAKSPPGSQVAQAEGTRVSQVMAVMGPKWKTVEDLALELDLPEDAIRDVLYSKFVKPKLNRSKIGSKTAFQLKRSREPVAKTGDKTVASLVRESLAKHSEARTPAQIAGDIATALAEIKGTKGAVTATLYNLKKSGKVIHDETAGTYRLAN